MTKSKQDYDYHVAFRHGPASLDNPHQCAICKEVFPGSIQLQRHRQSVHGTSARPETNVLVNLDVFADEPGAPEELEDNKHFLVAREINTKFQKIVNFPLFEYDTSVIGRKIDEVFASLTSAVKMNVSLGYLLKNMETGMFRYFYAENNNPLLELPITVATSDDLENLKTQIELVNFNESVTAARPDTKWKFYKLTNVSTISTL